MKKFFAILAVLVLFGTYAWATDDYNTFKMKTECKAMSVLGGNTYDLGSYVAGYDGSPNTGSEYVATWTLSNWGIDGKFNYTITETQSYTGVTLSTIGAWNSGKFNIFNTHVEFKSTNCNASGDFTLTVTNVKIAEDVVASDNISIIYTLTVTD